VAALRDAEASTIAEAARKHRASEPSIHRWRKQVHDRYHNTETLRSLAVKDEATGFYLAIKVDRHLRSEHVKVVLIGLITRFGTPQAIRCDNGQEFLADALRREIERCGILLANIEPGEPWQNGSNESFNGTFRKECLNSEIFASLMEARWVVEQWRRRYNDERPLSSQNYITPTMAFFGLTTMRVLETRSKFQLTI
jgi:putative transposase